MDGARRDKNSFPIHNEMINKFKKQSGLTLLETVIAISIFVVSAIVIVSLFIYHTKIFKIEESLSSLKIHKSLFTRNFNEAGEAASAVASSQAIGGNQYISSTSTVIFKIPAIDADGNLLANFFDYVIFYRDNSSVFMETEAASGSRKKSGQKLLASATENLIFRYDSATPAGASSVSSFLYLKSSSAQDLISATVFLRNK